MAENFDVFNADWWDPQGSFKTLHWITPVRFSYFLEKFAAIGGAQDKTVLDIGCGGGLISERFREAGAIVTGIDVSHGAIEAAKAHAEKNKLTVDYRVSTIQEFIKANPSQFDCVIASEVLEHVERLDEFTKDAVSVLRAGGIFLFSTINKTLRARLIVKFMAEDVLKLIPKGAHDFTRFIKPSQLANLLRKNSVDVVELKGINIDLFVRGFNITDDTSVNYIGYGVKSPLFGVPAPRGAGRGE